MSSGWAQQTMPQHATLDCIHLPKVYLHRRLAMNGWQVLCREPEDSGYTPDSLKGALACWRVFTARRTGEGNPQTPWRGEGGGGGLFCIYKKKKKKKKKKKVMRTCRLGVSRGHIHLCLKNWVLMLMLMMMMMMLLLLLVCCGLGGAGGGWRSKVVPILYIPFTPTALFFFYFFYFFFFLSH